jgi:hypothetical protein
MAKYRKKPIVIEAEQFWPDKEPWPATVERGPDDILTGTSTYWMDTLEGPFVVTPGDWIITGVKGEKYPCKADVFEMTYEPVAPRIAS